MKKAKMIELIIETEKKLYEKMVEKQREIDICKTDGSSDRLIEIKTDIMEDRRSEWCSVFDLKKELGL